MTGYQLKPIWGLLALLVGLCIMGCDIILPSPSPTPPMPVSLPPHPRRLLRHQAPERHLLQLMVP